MPVDVEVGRVEYGPRAFHQDAMEAMRGDIVRGIIELVTNCDDAYSMLADGRTGKITVEVEHRRGQTSQLIVRDRATGMRRQDLKDRIIKLGQRTSGFEAGHDVRGNLGRGAKDVAAFGDVRFRSIKDGRYSELLLHSNGATELSAEVDATSAIREELGIRGTGTVVEITVADNVRVPRHPNLKVKLNTHYQLRRILSDTARRVELINLNTGDAERLSYAFPNLEVAFEGNIDISGYPGAQSHLRIWRLPERCDDSPSDPGRPTGILICGRRAVYENTLFSFESSPHSGWFCGMLECPYIDQLAREYDQRYEQSQAHPPENPIPIISRRRDGLAIEHPFVHALRAAVDRPLGDLVAREAERARQEGGGESDETRAALDRAARELSRLIAEEMRDIEAEEPPGPEEGLPPLLSLVPSELIVYMGEDRTITVAARNENIAVGDKVEVTAEPTGVIEVLTPSVTLREHSRREDVLVAQIRVRPLLEGEATLLVASMPDRSADAIVEVRPPREVVEVEILAPENLEFERPSYRVGWQRRKELVLRAPAGVVAELGKHVQVRSSDSGVVIRTPTVELEFDDALDYYRAKVVIEARVLDAHATISATLGNAAAETRVVVTRHEEGPSYVIRFDHGEWGFWRAIQETEPLEGGGEQVVIKICARHPGIRPFLGEHNEGQNSPVCRGIIAETVADVAARRVVSELYRLRRAFEPFDADRLYREHNKRVARFLPRLQRMLVGEPEAAIRGEAAPAFDMLAGAPARE